MNYITHFTIYFSIYALLSLSVNLTMGYCGFLNLATASFFSIGAYSYALLAIEFHFDVIAILFTVTFLCIVLSLGLSIPSWRYRGDLFTVISLAFQVILFGILYNWHRPGAHLGSIENLTNGPFGIGGLPRPRLGSYRLSSEIELACFSVIILVIAAVILSRLQESVFGLSLQCMRDDEIALRGLGKNTRIAKLQAFGLSCSVAGIAGTLYASYVRYIDPSIATFDASLIPLTMALVGGLGSIRGSFLGVLIILLVPDFLRLVDLPGVDVANCRILLYGVFLAAFAHWRPQGLFGRYQFE